MTNSRAAGQRAERSIRDRLRQLWPDIRRGLGQSTGAQEPDLEGDIPIRAEVKEWKRWPDVEAAIEQVRGDADKYQDSRPRCVLHRRKNKQAKFRTDWRVTFELDEFVRFVEGLK